jgi:hypothetical protein
LTDFVAARAGTAIAALTVPTMTHIRGLRIAIT